ncbi:Ig-like domain-containing protein [Taklimakanibacter deserti]|uniref:Ig-like domain-containing protein n=1 Tax=Taklimakanibacter deserti TaxID=2267839 RepID=UPI0013C533AA
MAGLPLLAALGFNSTGIEAKLTEAAGASLAEAKADWAKVTFNGRDGHIEGDAPGRLAIDEAVKAVAGTQGVRRVDAAQAKVVLAAPTVDTLVTNNNRPEVKGTWPEIYAKTLSVILPDRQYALGKDPEVKSDGAGNWSFAPAEPLKDGAYDIAVEVDDGAGATSKTATQGKITIDTVAPPLPVFAPVTSQVSPQSLSGSWAEGDAAALKVGLADKTYTLGQDPALASAGGNWTLTLPEPLADGAYDLTVEAIDAAGNSARLNMPDAVTISSKPPGPTVAKYSGNDSTPLVSGSWGEAQGSKLQVAVGGKAYELGRDANLTSDGTGNWRLDIAAPLKDGIYDAVVTVTDAQGNVAKDETVAEIEVDATAPAVPVVNEATSLPVTGSFAPRDTKVLRATLAGHSYTLGQDAALTADGETWSLMPPAELPAGTYDVIVEAVDGFGNVSADASKDELVVAEDATSPSPPVADMTAPTVTVQEATAARPTITGTWAEGAAKSLKVTLAEAGYTLGANEELTSSSGQWSLKLPAPLKDGIYDVVVETTDAAGKLVTDTTKDELSVDAAGPATPTVKLYASAESPAAISGTWPEGDAAELAVTFNNKTAKLGGDESLKSDGKGNWSLTVTDKLQPGSYDVVATATDKRGRSAADQTRFEVLIKEAATEPTPVEPPPTEPTTTEPTPTGPTTTEPTPTGPTTTEPTPTEPTTTEPTPTEPTTTEPTPTEPTTTEPTPTEPPTTEPTTTETPTTEPTTTEPPTTEPTTTEPTTTGPTTTPPTADCTTGLAKTLLDRPLHFDRDKSAVTPAAAAIIKDLSAIAATCPAEKLEIGGHTDNIGSEPYNQALSERRAVAVMHALGEAGVAADRLSAVGYGETVPVGDNGTDEGRARNRRIEIKIVK